ncbi:hypothetical protein TRAPUB_14062 [Trametes pubescens]|uniref:Uncharacterized protein n=1 Tax=Trametes pubescens TaxID=154538 RepID=A0A1M2VPC6_TRAPU|nr:hypothetical protein TRAPUB_14062 [Trametes pubescens]
MSTNDSCPIVHIHDSPDDLRHMLRVYMPRLGGPSPAFHTNAPKYSYDAVAAAVRLGHKYQMSALLDDALSFLKTYYPTDYDKWKAYTQYGPPGFSRECAIGVVSLARLTNDMGLLLMALLVCCTIGDGEKIVNGFKREDGSREHLTPSDIGLCYSAKTRLVAASARLMLRVFLPEVSDACKTSLSCMQGFQRIIKALGDDTSSFNQHPDPSVSTYAFQAALKKGGLCVHCRKVVVQREMRERKSAWAKLPEAFGLALPPQGPIEAGQAGV